MYFFAIMTSYGLSIPKQPPADQIYSGSLLEIAGKETCGSDRDRWDKKRVDQEITLATKQKATLVLPLATIIETGNHIAQAAADRFPLAEKLADLMRQAADENKPWAAFTQQAELWDAKGLRELAEKWPDQAAKRISIGDSTIIRVAEYYARTGAAVEIWTGDAGLKAYQPLQPPVQPRRRR